MEILIFLLIVLTILLLPSFFIFYISMSVNKKPGIKPDAHFLKTLQVYKDKGEKVFQNLNREDLYINSFDNLKLHATYIDKKAQKTIVCVHGYRSSYRNDFFQTLPLLNKLDCNLLLVDNRGHGESEGKYIGFGVLDSYDILSWLSYLRQRQNDSKFILYGISMGAATVLNAAGNDLDDVIGVIADCGFSSGYDEVCNQIRVIYHLPPFPFVPLSDLFLKLFAHYSLKEKEAKTSIRNYHKDLLVIHGEDDRFVDTSMSYIIFKNANEPKQLEIFPDASHARSHISDPERYDELLSGFIKRI